MFPEELETERLRLLQFCRETVSPRDLYAAAGRPSDTIEEETALLTWDPHPHVERSRWVLETNEENWENGDRATYAIVPKATESDGRDDYPQAGDCGGAFAGFTGLDFSWDRRSVEFGTWLRKPFWGNGYLGERAPVLFELAFERLDLELVEAVHVHGNERARRGIEKYLDEYGGRHEGRLRNRLAPDGEPRDAHRYTISREEYRQATE